jgi:hypothetical protein
MRIRDAITDLSIQREVKRRLGKTHEANAIELGIEALERCEYNYLNPQRADFRRLPSETEK